MTDPLRTLLRTEAQGQAALRALLADVPLLDAVPILCPGYERPTHLAALADCYERAFRAACGLGPPVFALVAAPPQVGKTKLAQVAYAWWLAQRPQDGLALLMYGQDIASDKSREVRAMCLNDLGIALRTDTTAADRWATTAGGGLLARGLDGGIIGQSGLVCLAIDDPYRNRAQAESAVERARIHGGFDSSVWSRRHPRTSVIIEASRYAPDDLTGTLHAEGGWELHTIPAINDDGTINVTFAGRDQAFWDRQRHKSEHEWWSLYQGAPRARGGTLFRNGVSFYSEVPVSLRICIGLDFAYSAKTKADWSVAVVLGKDSADRCYVLRVVREQVAAPDFAATLKLLAADYPGAPMRAYIGGTELGTIDFLERAGLRVEAVTARTDKHSRAQGAAAAWSSGSIMVPLAPEGEPSPRWVAPFTGEILDFKGDGTDRWDDQADALVAAWDGLRQDGGGVYLPPHLRGNVRRQNVPATGSVRRPWDGPGQSTGRKPWQ